MPCTITDFGATGTDDNWTGDVNDSGQVLGKELDMAMMKMGPTSSTPARAIAS